jgi:predicted nucleotidyltransferase
MARTDPTEIALENLHTSGIDDYAVQIAELYENIMETYVPVELAYRNAVEALASINGFSSSTNC